jgi:hypothetical protein
LKIKSVHRAILLNEAFGLKVPGVADYFIVDLSSRHLPVDLRCGFDRAVFCLRTLDDRIADRRP